MTSQDNLIKDLCHLSKFGFHRHCGSWDIIFFIFYVTSFNHVFKGWCVYMGGRPHGMSPLAIFDDHWSNVREDIMYLVRHVT